MIIGVPKEVKDHEGRVALLPWAVRALARNGHRVLVEPDAGKMSGVRDEDYLQAGAVLVPKTEVFANADLVVKVKEPLEPELPLIKKGQALFTYLHLASHRPLLDCLLEREAVAIAYETVRRPDGFFPLLIPMSEIAGRAAGLVGAYYLQNGIGGGGKLISGVPGVKSGKVVTIGAGTVGLNAARIAKALEASVLLVDRDPAALRRADERLGPGLKTMIASDDGLAREVVEADIVIGAVLVPGDRAPIVVPRDWVRQMRPGAVIVDVSIDQGGCVEGIRATTHSDPVYTENGVIHYAVTNIPGIVPLTSTPALVQATFPYIERLAALGVESALRADPSLAAGMNTYRGEVVHPGVASAFHLKARDPLGWAKPTGPAPKC